MACRVHPGCQLTAIERCVEFGGQVRLDLGLTSPQAQWLSRGGSIMSTHRSSDNSGADPATTSFLDSPFKHRFARRRQSLFGRSSKSPYVQPVMAASL